MAASGERRDPILSSVASPRGRRVSSACLPILAVQLVLRPLFPEYRDWADFALWLGYFVIGIGPWRTLRVMPPSCGAGG